MNRMMIIGNLTWDPELRDYNGTPVCNFTVAINKRVRDGEQPQADFVRVSAWRELGEICAKYLAKGRKVYVDGYPKAEAYISREGHPRANINIVADHVEFLTPKGADANARSGPEGQEETGFTEVDDDELPF